MKALFACLRVDRSQIRGAKLGAVVTGSLTPSVGEQSAASDGVDAVVAEHEGAEGRRRRRVRRRRRRGRSARRHRRRRPAGPGDSRRRRSSGGAPSGRWPRTRASRVEVAGDLAPAGLCVGSWRKRSGPDGERRRHACRRASCGCGIVIAGDPDPVAAGLQRGERRTVARRRAAWRRRRRESCRRARPPSRGSSARDEAGETRERVGGVVGRQHLAAAGEGRSPSRDGGRRRREAARRPTTGALGQRLEHDAGHGRPASRGRSPGSCACRRISLHPSPPSARSSAASRSTSSCASPATASLPMSTHDRHRQRRNLGRAAGGRFGP